MFTDMVCLVEREKIVKSQHQAEAGEDLESVDEGLLTPMSRRTLE